MKPKVTYVVLTTRGAGWEAHGPLAVEYGTLKEAEVAARDLSARYPQKTVGVYELRSLFGTQQKVVKQRVEAPAAENPVRQKIETQIPTAENIVKLRTTN
jgi:hypothetical protein